MDAEVGYTLFAAGWTQKHIASALKVTEKTVSGWAKKYRWDDNRTEQALIKETSEANLWQLINYQLKALNKKREEYEEEGSFKLLQAGDIDALSKMYSQVKGKQHSWDQMVQLITEFISFIESRDLNLAKKMLPLSDEFLLNKKGAMLN